mgnify:CR=1 FL=1
MSSSRHILSLFTLMQWTIMDGRDSISVVRLLGKVLELLVAVHRVLLILALCVLDLLFAFT